MTRYADTARHLAELIAFPTVSRTPNVALIHYVRDQLAQANIESQIIPSADGTRANLYATTGPTDIPGVMLSGHTDVVPVEGQAWTRPPFELAQHDGRYYGRGTADMKGFVACAISAMQRAATRPLRTPLHLALSFDEEIGCVGVRDLLEILAAAPFCPRFGIIGEPTDLQVAIGHKGKMAFEVIFTGKEAHSALPTQGLSALHLACDFVQGLRDLQDDLAANGSRDAHYAVPYSTVHVGVMSGGTALNIVPNHAQLTFEIRNIAEDDPQQLLQRVRLMADTLVATAREQAEEADIHIETLNTYPGLGIAEDADIVSFVRSLTGGNSTIKVAFGTEAGLFSDRLDLPVVVCGPGSMDQGHKADEFISEEQLGRCEDMLDRLIGKLEAGLDA
jgi:acetylornithine deacetylase